MRSTSLVVPQLRLKLDILKLRAGIRSDQQLSERLGIKPPTLAGYLSNKGTSIHNSISKNTFDNLCSLIIETLNQRISHNQAVQLLLGNQHDFRKLFNHGENISFRQLLQQQSKSVELTIHVAPNDQAKGMVEFFTEESGHGASSATVGDAIYLECRGTPGWLVIVLVETALGFHLVTPRNKKLIRIHNNGASKIPASGRLLKLSSPGGIHRFYAICVDNKAPLHISTIVEPISFLSSQECDNLVDDLTNQFITKKWSVAQHDLFVKDKTS